MIHFLYEEENWRAVTFSHITAASFQRDLFALVKERTFFLRQSEDKGVEGIH